MIRAQSYAFSQLWFDTNGFAGSDLQNGGYNRSLACSAALNQLYVANRGGSASGITVLNPDNGAVIGSVSGAGALNPDQILVADDGVLYAIPLQTSLTGTDFAIYSWANWNNAPYQCYTPIGSDGTSSPLVSGYRAGDNAAITGAGTNTVILCGIDHGVASTNCVFLFSTADGLNFTATLLCITNLPATYTDLGPAHGYSFYTNGTFIFKPGGSFAYLIQFPTNFASLPNPVNVRAIATNALGGNSVVTDFSPAAHVLATLQLPQGAGNNSAVTLYSLASFSSPLTLAGTNTANPNSNGNDTGSVVFGGPGKTNLLFTLDSNNGLYAWSLVPGAVLETGVPTPALLQSALNSATQGMVLNLEGVDALACPQIALTQTYTGGKLIFSDSPESPTNTGLLYIDTNLPATTAAAPNRVFVYHVNNNAAARMSFSVLLKNNGPTNATLAVVQSGFAGPSTSYAYVGETAVNRWLTNFPGTTLTVAPGQIVRLDTNFDSTSVRQNYLMNGIWDYTFTQPHTIMICALNPGSDPVAVGPTLPVLARDSHVRATFAACNKTCFTPLIDTAAGIQQYPIGGTGDTEVAGFDNAVTPPTAESNDGNYGLLYNFQINTSASDARALGLLFSPRGGAWSGAIGIDPGILPGGDFLVPAGGVSLSSTTNAVVGGEYYPNAGQAVHLQFMPTGGSSFPVCLLTVPYAATGPDLTGPGNLTVNPGQTARLTATAASGTPPLTFTLPAAPAGATIGGISGAFAWRAPIASAGTTQTVQVQVTDSATPPRADIQSFTITVNPLAPVTLSAPSATPAFQVRVAGPVGPDYILQAATNLANAAWVSLSTNTPAASPFTLADPAATNFAARFYRLILGP